MSKDPPHAITATSEGSDAVMAVAALWPRPVIVDRFGPRPFEMRLEASEAERLAIARAYGCLSVETLSATLTLTRAGARLKVAGLLEAAITQACVVTLEPVAGKVSEKVSLTFAPQLPVRGGKGRAGTESEETIQMDVADPPEPIVDGTVDLGPAMLEFFALALDPYPRKAGAAFAARTETDASEHPFAALGRLKEP